MSNYYSDPTASKAIGAVDKELRLMRRKAARIRALRKSGWLTPEALEAARKEFTGIYRRLLVKALSDPPKKEP